MLIKHIDPVLKTVQIFAHHCLVILPLLSATAVGDAQPRLSPQTAEKPIPPRVKALLEKEMNEHQGEYDHTLATLKKFRDHWHGWVLRHVPELRKLIHAADNDFDTYDRVYALLPSKASTAEVSGITHQDFVDARPSHFTWQPYFKVAKTLVVKDEKKSERHKNSLVSMDNHNHEIFMQKRDIELSYSTPIVGHTLILWSSGRITDREVVGRDDSAGSGKPIFREKEVTPVFDELKNNKEKQH